MWQIKCVCVCRARQKTENLIENLSPTPSPSQPLCRSFYSKAAVGSAPFLWVRIVPCVLWQSFECIILYDCILNVRHIEQILNSRAIRSILIGFHCFLRNIASFFFHSIVHLNHSEKFVPHFILNAKVLSLKCANHSVNGKYVETISKGATASSVSVCVSMWQRGCVQLFIVLNQLLALHTILI